MDNKDKKPEIHYSKTERLVDDPSKSGEYVPFTRKEFMNIKYEDIDTTPFTEGVMVKAVKIGLVSKKTTKYGVVAIIRENEELKKWKFGYIIHFRWEGRELEITLITICFWLSAKWLYDENHDALWSPEERRFYEFKPEK